MGAAADGESAWRELQRLKPDVLVTDIEMPGLTGLELAQRIQRRLREQGDAMDWESVSQVSHAPRSVPVPLTRSGTSPDSVIAEARRVRNIAPLGANLVRVSP